MLCTKSPKRLRYAESLEGESVGLTLASGACGLSPFDLRDFFRDRISFLYSESEVLVVIDFTS
jgi:hypothetical protein